MTDNFLKQICTARVTHLLEPPPPLTIREGVHIVPSALRRHIALPARGKMAIQGIFSCLRSCLSGFLLRKEKNPNLLSQYLDNVKSNQTHVWKGTVWFGILETAIHPKTFSPFLPSSVLASSRTWSNLPLEYWLHRTSFGREMKLLCIWCPMSTWTCPRKWLIKQ